MLKGIHMEELPDLFIFRPLAFLLVKVFYPFPITPNQVSFLAISPGVSAAYYFSRGDARSFFVAGILAGLFCILDCADGMIARLKKNGTKTGRLVDGLVDYIVGISVYVGLAIGLSRAVLNHRLELPCNPWIPVIIAAVSNFSHSGVTDYFRNLYDAHKNGKKITPPMEMQEFAVELERLNLEKGKRLDKFMINLYFVYLRLQGGKRAKPFVRFGPGEYQKHNRLLLTLWNFIGPTTHISALIIGALLYKPMIFFYYTIIFANLWMLILFLLQNRVNKKLSAKSNVTSSKRFSLPGVNRE